MDLSKRIIKGYNKPVIKERREQ